MIKPLFFYPIHVERFKSNLYAMKNLLLSYRWAWKKILLYRQERIRWWCEILFKLILPYWRYWWIKYYEVSIYLLNQVIRPRFSLSLLPTRNRKKNNLKMICRGLSIFFDTVYFPNLFVVSGQVVHSWVKISSC